MSLLQDAAAFEDNRWQRRLRDWRRDAAIAHLRRVGGLLGGFTLAFLLFDGARRDAAHGTATVVALQGNAALQTAKGKLAPSFIGQSYSVGDSLTTDDTGTVTLAFPDGSVLEVAPRSQVALVQSDSFRNSRRYRLFSVLTGKATVYATGFHFTHFIGPNLKLETRQLSCQFTAPGGITSLAAASRLAKYSIKNSTLIRLENALWAPGNALLNAAGVTGSGTLLGTESQLKADCHTVGKALQAAIKQNPELLASDRWIPLESLSLPAQTLTLARRCVVGPVVRVATGGLFFTARDARNTYYVVRPTGVYAHATDAAP